MALSIAADFRLCTPDWMNDHIWELEMGGGDPAAISLRTTYGLRACSMRIFTRFLVAGNAICDPTDFAQPPSLKYFAPNFLEVEYSPSHDLHVTAETWIPDSQAAAGRMKLRNDGNAPLTLQVEICGQLSPMGGKPLSEAVIQRVQVLSGTTSDLSPVLFLTGGAYFTKGPYPALGIELRLAAGEERTLSWVQAALGTQEASFEHARRIAAHSWEGERARIELVNEAQTIEVYSGDPDWDAAFALSQKNAYSLFLPARPSLPEPVFVQSRQPDQGCQPVGATDPAWDHPTALDSVHLASVLPGAPMLASGMVFNFLHGQGEDGFVSWKPGQKTEHQRWLSAPLLGKLARDTFARLPEGNLAATILPKLEKFLQCWLDARHDRDGDGFPEWDHPLQAGMEDQVSFPGWWAECPGGDCSQVETPSLIAMLCQDFHALAQVAGEAGLPEKAAALETQANHFQNLVEECWDERTTMYHQRDRDSHYSPIGKLIAVLKGPGKMEVGASFPLPTRLMVEVNRKEPYTGSLEIHLKGRGAEGEKIETLERIHFPLGSMQGQSSTQALFTEVDSVQVSGLGKKDTVNLRVMDFSREDISLFLPLWAGIPDQERARVIVAHSLLPGKRFGRLFGIPCTIRQSKRGGREDEVVSLPWNAMIAEGLLAYGFQAEAVHLLGSMMGAVITSLKQQRAFHQYYEARSGAGRGERNSIQGLAPLGLFLKILGVEFRSPGKVILSRKNPYPWPVTVKYRGIIVTRWVERTKVDFPGGESITLSDPTDAVLEA